MPAAKEAQQAPQARRRAGGRRRAGVDSARPSSRRRAGAASADFTEPTEDKKANSYAGVPNAPVIRPFETMTDVTEELTRFTYRRPQLYRKQYDALFNDDRIALCEASPKTGKTSGALAWIAEEALVHGKPGRNFWWIAPVYSQAKIAYRRLKRALRGIAEHHDTDMTLTLPNEAVIWFKSGSDPDNLYGEDVWGVVVDEASRMPEDSWDAINTTTTFTQASIRIIGNRKGRGNWFFRMCQRAMNGEPDHHYVKMVAQDAVDAGVLKQKTIDQVRATMSEVRFRELYMLISDDEGNPFGFSHIQACLLEELADGPAVSYGLDPARHRDWFVIIGINEGGQVCEFDRFQGIPWEETIERATDMIGDVPSLMDSTHGSIGDPLLEMMQKKCKNLEGYEFTTPSKQQLMEDLAIRIQHHQTRFPEGEISNELENFEYRYTTRNVLYSAPEGLHDDCVMALAMGLWKSGRAPKPPARMIPLW